MTHNLGLKISFLSYCSLSNLQINLTEKITLSFQLCAMILASAIGCVNYCNIQAEKAKRSNTVPDEFVKTVKSVFFPYTTSSMVEPTEFSLDVSSGIVTEVLNAGKSDPKGQEVIQRIHGFDLLSLPLSPNELSLFLGQTLLLTNKTRESLYSPSWTSSPTVNHRTLRPENVCNPNVSSSSENNGILGTLFKISNTGHSPSLIFPDYSIWPHIVSFQERKKSDDDKNEKEKNLVLTLFRHLRHLNQPSEKDTLTCEHVTAKHARKFHYFLNNVSLLCGICF